MIAKDSALKRIGIILLQLLVTAAGIWYVFHDPQKRAQIVDALRKADRSDVGPLSELIARAIVDNLTRFILPAIAGPARLLPLESLATKDLNMAALYMAARRGRLRAIQGPDRVWRSSKQWVTEYRASRYGALRQAPGRAASEAVARNP